MSAFNDPMLERNPFAHSSYRDYVEERTVEKDNKIAGLRNIVLGAFAALLLINIFSTLFLSGLYTVDEEGYFINRPGKVDITPKDGGVSDSDSAEPVVKGTSAYWNIVPPVGDCASIIQKYITYERGVMSPDEVILSFTGDCTLGTWPESSNETNYNRIYADSGSPTYSFDNVRSLFANDDYTYINLETTLTTSNDRFKDKTYNFKGDPAWAKDMLKASGIDGCNISNNHSWDYQQSGYDETVRVCEEAGMDVGDQDRIIQRNIEGINFVFIQGCYIFEKVQLSNYKYGEKLTELIISEIKEYKRADNIVVVSCHWGLERKQMPNYEQWDPARAFVDAGADIVIGHHPHTVESVELYNGHYIFYSIGNFAFGGKATTDEINRMSLIVRPRFALRDGKAELTGVLVVPCYTTSAKNIETNDYRPRPLCGQEAKSMQYEVEAFSEYVKYGVDSIEMPTAAFTE